MVVPDSVMPAYPWLFEVVAEVVDALVEAAGHLEGLLGVRHRQTVHVEELTQSWPGDDPITRDENDQVVVLSTAHHHRLDEVGRVDAPHLRRLLE